ncbi:MAG: hypothetical protein AAGA68_19590 [Pseudomonadota bacterium]
MKHTSRLEAARLAAGIATLLLSFNAAADAPKTPSGLSPADSPAAILAQPPLALTGGIPLCLTDGFDYLWRLEANVVSPPPRIELAGEVTLSESTWNALDGLITPSTERFRLVAVNPEADGCTGPSTSWFEYVLTRTGSSLEGEWRSYCSLYPSRAFRDGSGNIDATIVSCADTAEYTSYPRLPLGESTHLAGPGRGLPGAPAVEHTPARRTRYR